MKHGYGRFQLAFYFSFFLVSFFITWFITSQAMILEVFWFIGGVWLFYWWTLKTMYCSHMLKILNISTLPDMTIDKAFGEETKLYPMIIKCLCYIYLFSSHSCFVLSGFSKNFDGQSWMAIRWNFQSSKCLHQRT